MVGHIHIMADFLRIMEPMDAAGRKLLPTDPAFPGLTYLFEERNQEKPAFLPGGVMLTEEQYQRLDEPEAIGLTISKVF